MMKIKIRKYQATQLSSQKLYSGGFQLGVHDPFGLVYQIFTS